LASNRETARYCGKVPFGFSRDSPNEAVADTPRLAFDFHDLSDWDEPAEFPWDPEILLSLDRIDLVIADAGTSPTALAYLTGRGVPVVCGCRSR
jgi:hypothetical protein